MIKKTLSYLSVTAAVAGTGVASFKLGNMLGIAIVNRFYKPRISEITVWNGPIPAHPSSL